MTDRELLEQAAKAIRAKPDEISLDGTHWFGRSMWNPLSEDADAFRLAVKLHIDVRHDMGEVAAILTTGPKHVREPTPYIRKAELREPDPNAATRRAIVRAAAAFAKLEAA